MRTWIMTSISVVLVALPSVGASQAADGFFTRAGRPYVFPPDAVWNEVKRSVGREGKPMGYSYEEMLGYIPGEFRMRMVENLFRDTFCPSEYAGLLSNNLIAYAKEPAQLSYILWGQLDARAAREWAVPKEKGDWGVAGIPKGARPQSVIDFVLKVPKGSKSGLNVEGLDTATQTLIARILVAVDKAQPWLEQANGLKSGRFGPGKQANRSRQVFYDLVTSPYYGDVNDDTIVVRNREAYDAMRLWDANYSAFGTAEFLRRFDVAMAEYNGAQKSTQNAAFKTIVVESRLGRIAIGGVGPDSLKNADIVIDLGGDDHYSGSIATPSSSQTNVGLVLDLGGKDTYDGSALDGNVACGFFGVGMIYDVSGDDIYRVRNGGLGFGLFGTGMLVDLAGNDLYEAKKGWAQGAAYAGVGLLLDHSGNDKYRTICMSMGFGGTLGMGALVDLAGNDDYFTADKGNESKAWGRTVSMALGCGYGRRNDSGDGHNQGGGIGIVVEVAGDDTYHTGVFSLGSGYWWGAGLFEERGGNDTYRSAGYSLGSGAHFAVGSFVEMEGNDRYNDRPDAGSGTAAIGRDGSVATCFDLAGDDIWGNIGGGFTNLNSYSLFWERQGNDTYKRMEAVDPANPATTVYGYSAIFPQMLNFRDRKPSIAVFLDTNGTDEYDKRMSVGNDKQWQVPNGPMFWGYGRDFSMDLSR